MTHKCTGWFELPYTTAQPKIQGEYLYLSGGYNTVDAGCPPWGTNKEFEALFIGDQAGELSVLYENGERDTLPLLFGYTLWFKTYWNDTRSPFAEDENLYTLLDDTLQLYGAIDAQEEYILKVKIRPLPIASVEVFSNNQKTGSPVFSKGRCEKDDSFATAQQKAFFKSHFADAANPIPETVLSKLDTINHALMTYESDYHQVPAVSYPDHYNGTRITFSGTPFATITTGVFKENMLDMISRIDASGFIHESAKDAPSWLYNGYGAYKNNMGAYYNQQYARNFTGVISTLHKEAGKKLEKAVHYAHQCLMTPVNRKLTIKGIPVPGHWTMVINHYDFYQDELAKAGWPTQYTKERFGDEYKNMGSMETDGHGLMMMLIYTWWRDCNQSAAWVNENWTYLNEAAAYILWCLQHPECSFADKGLLYGESEAGMQEHTLHLNIPCFIGLKMYADMAQTAGKDQAAQAWRAAADSMETAILKNFSNNGQWLGEHFGFYHDPSISTYADYIGYDPKNDLSQNWYALSANTFASDIDRYIKDTFVGPRGIGYDQNVITQNALLLDKIAEAEKFVNNLMRICYAPRLLKAYIVPECVTYSAQKQAFRRQGDLGNLVQQAETIKTLKMMAGVSLPQGKTIKLLPRLVKGWSIHVQDAVVPSSQAVLSYQTAYPAQNGQSAVITILNSDGMEKVRFRGGPFAPDAHLTATVNGTTVPLQTEIINTMQWAWAEFDITQSKDYAVQFIVL